MWHSRKVHVVKLQHIPSLPTLYLRQINIDRCQWAPCVWCNQEIAHKMKQTIWVRFSTPSVTVDIHFYNKIANTEQKENPWSFNEGTYLPAYVALFDRTLQAVRRKPKITVHRWDQQITCCKLYPNLPTIESKMQINFHKHLEVYSKIICNTCIRVQSWANTR